MLEVAEAECLLVFVVALAPGTLFYDSRSGAGHGSSDVVVGPNSI